MTLTEIKTSISNLSPEEQAELDLWWTEQEAVAQRQAAFESLRRDLIEGYRDMESGRTRPWTQGTIGEIREEALRANRHSVQPEERCGEVKEAQVM